MMQAHTGFPNTPGCHPVSKSIPERGSLIKPSRSPIGCRGVSKATRQTPEGGTGTTTFQRSGRRGYRELSGCHMPLALYLKRMTQTRPAAVNNKAPATYPIGESK
jgi:hypothetical protein